MGTQQQKAAAAQVAGHRVHDGQGKAGGHGGVHGVATLAQHLKAGVGGQVVDADHHPTARAYRLLVAVRGGVHGALLGSGNGRDGQRDAAEGGQDGGKEPSIHRCGDRITRKRQVGMSFADLQVSTAGHGVTR